MYPFLVAQADQERICVRSLADPCTTKVSQLRHLVKALREIVAAVSGHRLVGYTAVGTLQRPKPL